MMIITSARALALVLTAPAATMLPVVTPSQAQEPSTVAVVGLRARFDPSLDSLRAGSAVSPASFDSQERSELAAAQQRSTTLDALRAGDGPSDNEWKWLAIGAGIILLIILI